MAEKTLTAPLGIIRFQDVNGKLSDAVGKIKNIRISESFQRGDVKGIGSLISVEKPILSINCTFSASSYFIDISKFGTTANPFFGNRLKASLSQFLDSLLFAENTINIFLHRPTATLDPTTGFMVRGQEEPIGVIRGVYLDNYNFDITEGAISGTDLSGTYLEPILTLGT